jgi:Suppressor of fused protein (SUFU)
VTAVLDAVREHLRATFTGPVVSASVTFLGLEPLEVLRFGPDPNGVVRYATVGISRRAMHPPTAAVIDPDRGPRAELVLSLRPARDDVLRSLAVLAATPDVEGVVLAAGVTLDLLTPLWPGARLSATLLAEPGGLVPDLDLGAAGDGVQPVRFYPVLPMTAAEAALSRAKGPALIRQLWLDAGTDLRDPDRGDATQFRP